uniref:Uncharacterized protein n=1 Tax=Fagus sylvatica TaxID=28930 RepID=A0A2N9HQD9_FAGSY
MVHQVKPEEETDSPPTAVQFLRLLACARLGPHAHCRLLRHRLRHLPD